MGAALLVTACQREGCQHQVEQQAGQHRRRRYCSNRCKQLAYRERVKQNQAREQQARVRARWGDLLPETLSILERILASFGEETTHQIAEAIAAEKQRCDVGGNQCPAAAREDESRLLEQAQARLVDLEQQLSRYRQIVDLDERKHLEQQLLAIGEQIGYRSFLPADHLTAVGSGLTCWQAFAQAVGDDTLARAIVKVKFYAENLLSVDAQVTLRKAQRRIVELERRAEQQSPVSSPAPA